MDGDEVDDVVDFPIAQPEFPHVGIGDGNGDLRFHRADDGREIVGRHLPAQQHLVADDERGDDAGILLGQANRGRNLREILQPVAAEPDALDDLQAYFCGLRRHLIEAVLDRVGAHAVGYFGELREILGDLLGRDMGGPQQRRLRVAEWRVGHAIQFRPRIDQRKCQGDRRGQPPPDGGNHAQGYQKQRQRRTPVGAFLRRDPCRGVICGYVEPSRLAVDEKQIFFR